MKTVRILVATAIPNSSGSPASGRWFSPYDGTTWTAASDVDIDHVVPLKNAWISGASSWSTAKRESFANDLTHPQLIAVTDNVRRDLSMLGHTVPLWLQGGGRVSTPRR